MLHRTSENEENNDLNETDLDFYHIFLFPILLPWDVEHLELLKENHLIILPEK